MSRLGFKLEATASRSKARAGRFNTLHNEVLTPLFMPVGTHATVRSGHRAEHLHEIGSQILLANTYHLLLRPGPEVFRKAGGIHPFMNWKRSVLTDSGGFQIFSLARARKMTEDGAVFRSYWDGREINLTPELSIETQKAINSDIMMALDQCIPSTADHETAAAAMELTFRWAKRSLEARGDSKQSLFGIVQGACFEDLRKISADQITSLPFDGFAIGGLAVGETKSERDDFTEYTAQLLPAHLPRYLMGVGTPIDLLEAVHRGVDMFDCILPNALAQQGVTYTTRGRIEMRRGVYKLAQEALDPGCQCYTCLNYTRSYLHHLIKAKEVLGWQLIAGHNLYFYHQLMSGMREAILADSFYEFYLHWRPILELTDSLDAPKTPPKVSSKSFKPKAKPMELGNYTVNISEEGHATVKQVSSGEIMHPIGAPEEEVRKIYIEQSRLQERIQDSSLPELVVWDVGLGAGTNAMAAIRAYEDEATKHLRLRPMHLVSFEIDLDAIRLAMSHPNLFPHTKHGGPSTLLEKKEWVSKKVSTLRWSLLEGDFLQQMAKAPLPDVVFFDPFSYKTDTQLWTLQTFQKLFAMLKDRSTSLFTYSNSTAVRAALLASGFYVAKGCSTGPKSDTTIALTAKARAEDSRYEVLGSEWLSRWERSGAKLPPQYSPESGDPTQLEDLIRAHEQFKIST